VPAPDDCPGIDACSTGAPLHEQIAALQRGQLDLLGQLDEVRGTLALQDDRIDVNAKALERIEDAAKQSAAQSADALKLLGDVRGTLQTISDMQAAGRLGARIVAFAKAHLPWMTAVAVAVVAAWQRWFPHKP